MKKLLVLTGRYYPKASPNSICVKQVIDALPGDWQTTVIAYDDGLKEEGEERVFRVGRGAVLSGVYRNEGSFGNGLPNTWRSSSLMFPSSFRSSYMMSPSDGA